MADIEVPAPGASEIVARLLSDALREHPDVKWLGLVSEDGFAIASEGAVSVDDDAVAAGAVRMMIQVRSMSKALGQTGASQMFLEGSESGICVIDKDPWVLIVMGAPGVPIGLLRYEAREIAEAFPMGPRPALTALEAGDDEQPVTDWTVVGVAEQAASDVDLDVTAARADEEFVTDPDGETEIRWADEPTSAATAGGVAVADSPDGHDIFGDAGLEGVEELEMPSVGSDDFADWAVTADESVDEAMFDLPAPSDETPVTFEMPAAEEPAFGVAPESAFDVAPEPAPVFDVAPEAPVFDVAPEPAFGTPADSAFDLPAPASADASPFDLPAPAPADASPFDLPAPVGPGFAEGLDDLSDLAPPSGPAIDLPPPAGPAYELPPPQ